MEKKVIYCFDLTGKLLKVYNSRKEAAEDLGVLDTLISNNIAGKIAYVDKKYWFSYENKFKELSLEEQLVGNILTININPIVCYDTINNFITIYPTPKFTDLPDKSWAMYCHKVKMDKKGRKWKYLKELPEDEIKRLLELKNKNEIKVININGESNI